MIKFTSFLPKISPITGYYQQFLAQSGKFSLFFLSPYIYAKVSEVDSRLRGNDRVVMMIKPIAMPTVKKILALKLYTQIAFIFILNSLCSLCTSLLVLPRRRTKLYAMFLSVKAIEVSWFWSSSPNANNSNNAWKLNFNNGNDNNNNRNNNNYVRLVRGGK